MELDQAKMPIVTTQTIQRDFEVFYTDRISVARKAFDRVWIEQMREDMMTSFWDAIQRPGGHWARPAALVSGSSSFTLREL